LGPYSPEAISLWVSTSYSDETSDAMTTVYKLYLGCPLDDSEAGCCFDIYHQGENETRDY